MGRNLTQPTTLPPPLGRVVERVMFLPRGARLRLNNVERKLVVVLDGKVRALVDGKRVGELAPGDALVVPGPCRQVYEATMPGREARLQALVISLAPTATGLAADFWEWHFGRLGVRPAVMGGAAHGWLEALRAEARRKGEGGELRVAAYAWLLLTELARGRVSAAREREEAMRQDGREKTRSEWMVARVRDYLAEHFQAALTLEAVAWHVHMSGEHVARTFRAQTGKTIFAEVEELRMGRARILLAGSQLGLAEVARQSGFGSATRLCRVFRRVGGETPLKYRLRVQAEATSSPSKFETEWI